jgi:hypothetical protein
MEGELEIELAVPAAEGVSGEGRFRADVLSAGRYGTLLHVGLYDDLIASNAALQDWAEEQSIVWDSWDTDRGSAWRGRVERYLTGSRPAGIGLPFHLNGCVTPSRNCSSSQMPNFLSRRSKKIVGMMLRNSATARRAGR